MLVAVTAKTQTIEIDETTAAQLRTRAAERGISISELLAELINLEASSEVDPDAIAELDRRWATFEAGGATASNEEVVRWLRTWGTPRFQRWRERWRT
jgi:predicted transcriptional regulator